MEKVIKTYTTLEAAAVIAAVAGGAVICQLNPPQVLANKPIRMGLTRLRVVSTTAVQGTFGLVAALTAGTPVGASTLVGEIASFNNGGYDGGSGPGRLISAWTVAPTIDATPLYYELDFLPATAGAGFEWTWPEDDPFFSKMSRDTAFFQFGLLLQNLNVGASPAMMVSARWSEFRTDS
jgi:hypothetical protein